MTVLRGGFAAKQAVGVSQILCHPFLNGSLGYQPAEICLIYCPLPFPFLECIKDLLGGRQIGPVDIVDAADRLQKIT